MTATNFSLIRLKFHSPLHLSRGKADYDSSLEVLHSDTIKSAIFVAALELGYDVTSSQKEEKDDINAFLDSFSVSSAFPYYNAKKDNEDNFRYFFPKSLTTKISIGEKDKETDKNNEMKNRKKEKAIKWLDQDYFSKSLQGTLEPVNGNIVSKAYLSDVFENDENPEIIKSEVMQRVTIPRDGSDAKPFYMDRLFFGENAGMFFLIEFNKKTYKQQVLNALTLLGENGFGTDRNVGNGNFSYKEDIVELTLPEITAATMQMNLSLYCPKEKTEFPKIISKEDTKTAYSLVKRGGWLANPQEDKHRSLRKKSIYMFAEGSVFNTKEKLEGKLVNLQPQDNNVFTNSHPIWRDGRAIFVAMV
jgi:CRISPR-associated protein Csm4